MTRNVKYRRNTWRACAECGHVFTRCWLRLASRGQSNFYCTRHKRAKA